MESSRRKVLVVAGVIVLTLGVGLLVASRASAARARGLWMPDPERRLSFLRAALDLTDEQTEHIREIMRTRQQAARPLLRELNEQARHLLELAQTEPPSSPATRATIERISALSAQLVALRLEGALEVRRELTPEQQQKAERFIRAMLDRWREWDQQAVQQ